jgi:hypothetical protein
MLPLHPTPHTQSLHPNVVTPRRFFIFFSPQKKRKIGTQPRKCQTTRHHPAWNTPAPTPAHPEPFGTTHLVIRSFWPWKCQILANRPGSGSSSRGRARSWPVGRIQSFWPGKSDPRKSRPYAAWTFICGPSVLPRPSVCHHHRRLRHC